MAGSNDREIPPAACASLDVQLGPDRRSGPFRANMN